MTDVEEMEKEAAPAAEDGAADGDSGRPGRGRRREETSEEDERDGRSRTGRRARAAPGEAEPRVLERPEHPVSRKKISEGTLKVLYRLDRKGYAGYLVGGGVRDLMLGREPKDFDVATDARPPEMKRLFRNARIIGRRFRLAHVIFRDEIVEVSTFRRTPDPEEQDSDEDDLLITSDNTWGTPSEDAFRRDFTINALFYDISDFSVLDYVGGLDDLEQKKIRVIGDPDVRLREDPVRMTRACEFAGRLGFEIEPATLEAIRAHAEEIGRAAPPRMVEEVLGILRSGHSAPTLGWMQRTGLLGHVLPELESLVEKTPAGDFRRIPEVLDRMIGDEGRKLDDPVLFGAVLLPGILERRFRRERETGEWTGMQDFRTLLRKLIEPLTDRLPLPNAKVARMRQALIGFHRMCAPRWTPARRQRIARKSYFEDAVFLFEVLVGATGAGHEELEAWRKAGKSAGGGGRGGRGGRGGGRRRSRGGRRRRRR